VHKYILLEPCFHISESLQHEDLVSAISLTTSDLKGGDVAFIITYWKLEPESFILSSPERSGFRCTNCLLRGHSASLPLRELKINPTRGKDRKLQIRILDPYQKGTKQCVSMVLRRE
jgi:hypothetical protein